MQAFSIFILISALAFSDAFGFSPKGSRLSGFGRSSASGRAMTKCPKTKLNMLFEGELGSTEYGILFVATIIPSLAFVKFVGDASDSSRGSLSQETQEKFRRSMMEQPGANLSLPTSEEEALKKAIAKAYMQDKDVDVAVLEEKLRKRALWRKEMMQEQKGKVQEVDEEGW